MTEEKGLDGCGTGHYKETAYIEDAEDLMRESPTYRKILKHRRRCKKWGKAFCLKCFGGGLTQFIRDFEQELK